MATEWLPSGYRVAEVLSRTWGFSIEKIRRRLLETTQHTLECTSSLESIKPSGAGFASSLRVQLLHASVRQRIIQLTAARPSYYSVEKNGVPVNDLDCIGTIVDMSATIIWQSLPRQGIYLRQQEILDYIALWRLIALLYGDTDGVLCHADQSQSDHEVTLSVRVLSIRNVQSAGAQHHPRR